ncbi:MAG: glycosyltransferase family 4 protein [Dehalococcoidia bacterium]
MRILMLSAYPNVQGPLPKHTPLLVDGLRSLGCEVVVAPWGKHRDVETRSERVVGRAGDIRRVRALASRLRPDVMVVKTAHDWPTLARDLPLVATTRRYCRSVVLQFHGSDPGRLHRPDGVWFKRATAALLRSVDGAMVLSTEEQREWLAFSTAAPFFVVENAFRPAAPAVDAGSSLRGGAEFRLLFVGRLLRQKDVYTLVEAMPAVLRRTPCRLEFVGDGPERQGLAERAAALGVQDAVTFSGYLTGGALRAAYDNADTFVLTSAFEGFPTVISEAMDSGLPVITTPFRGMVDHLRDGVNTLFVPPGDPAALAKAVARLAADPDLRGRMAAANRAKVKDFAPENVARRYLDVLQRVVTRRARQRVAVTAVAPRGHYGEAD